MNKLISPSDAASFIKDGMTLMIGGFLGHGTPERIIDEIVASGVKSLTLIVNDTAFPDKGCGKLVTNNQVKKLIVSHIGTNPNTGQKMNSGELEIEFSPQGTLAERIRSGGAGLGGILTPVGIGTIIEEGKQMIQVDGNDYLLEKPLRADIALIYATTADDLGNLIYMGTMRNFNPLMAMAADVSSKIVLNPQWNWIGYLPQFVAPVKEALSNLTAKEGDQIKGQVGFAKIPSP